MRLDLRRSLPVLNFVQYPPPPPGYVVGAESDAHRHRFQRLMLIYDVNDAGFILSKFCLFLRSRFFSAF